MAKKSNNNYKPLFIGWLIYSTFSKLYCKFKYHLKIDNKEFKKRDKSKGAIVLFNHHNNDDHFITSACLGMTRTNFVITSRFHYDKAKRFVFKFVKGITRQQFRPDMESTLKIKKILKNNGVIAIAPAGQVSLCGQETYLSESIVKLLKLFDCDVYSCYSEGSYIANPKWAKNKRRGNIKASLKKVLSKEDLKQLSNDTIFEITRRACYCDNFKLQESNKTIIKSKGLAEGLETALFICPTCLSKYTLSTNKNDIVCSKCQTTATFNKYALLEGPSDVYQNEAIWYNFQREVLKEEIKKEDFKFEIEVKMYRDLDSTNKLVEVGTGLLHLDRHNLYYDGTLLNNKYHKDFMLSHLVQIPFVPNVRFNIPDEEGMIEFVPVSTIYVTEFALLIDCYRELRDNNEL